ncbi:flavodoxin [Haloplasma contractile]|uniref:Flavodoxin n=1 Tax=Haloplasma contractile SSD-17B TaxID=1033810 RepID=F7Q1Z1_9MOLU|nr:flavodoxin [Haloplasma contractile]ERJ12197.1 nitrogenase protein [Haloplasma contractile SSD-17B]
MKNIVVIYWSGTGNTEMMAQSVAEGAKVNGDQVELLSVEEATSEDVISADLVALGCPSMGAENLEEAFMQPFVDSLEEVDFDNKPVVLFGSYDWGDGEWMQDFEDQMKEYGASLVTEGLIVNLTPEEDDLIKCKELGEQLASA